ncbi:MAG: sigma-70 family RNA polymerase sigma factor [Verrucomicrobia bacterium]|nr:sigma-70 family RNA polymerase sigma factor [Verrucomicrobiota bacterium]
MTKPQPHTKAERLSAFEGVVSEYEGALLRYAGRILANQTAAQDVVQNAFVRCYRNWKDGFEPSPQLSSWLYRVAHNCAVDYLRKESRRHLLHHRQAEHQPTAVAADRGAAFRISDQAAQAARALQTLDLREQQLVILKIYEEKSYKEISTITGLTTSNVGYILHHAMKKMARVLTEEASVDRP